mmetsp:Transcript_60276/g.140880  ORF Transcript_60276/g.140880 Transcript_60276/m.140880 type:complete len:198 (-) Transcript_60276:29-622(-)
MNFVRAETIVQEITGDGKVRDIVTQVKKSDAEREAERKESVLRSLPEFKRDGQSTAEQIAANTAEEKEKDKDEKEYNVHTIDEAEFEHYQLIEDVEREKKRKQLFEDREAVALFETERKRLREDVDEKPAKPTDLISLMRQQNLEKAEKKGPATTAPLSRLKGKITVKAKGAEEKKPAAPVDSLGALAGYGSDSGSE